MCVDGGEVPCLCVVCDSPLLTRPILCRSEGKTGGVRPPPDSQSSARLLQGSERPQQWGTATALDKEGQQSCGPHGPAL